MNRITNAFSTAKKAKRAAFIAYITAGDPNIDTTVVLATALRRGGADLLELGVPFSDPIADGATNQRAAERALSAGTTLQSVLEAVRAIRQEEEIPIILFSYANPVLRYGIDRFAEDAAAAGVDGVLFTDVPVEEIERFRPALLRSKIDPIMLVTPTSPRARVKAAAKAGRGFLYFVSRTGVTGARRQLDSNLEDLVRAARKTCKLPVSVGFGISTPAQVSEIAAWADGIVVGSAIVDHIAKIGESGELCNAVQRFITPLTEACRR